VTENLGRDRIKEEFGPQRAYHQTSLQNAHITDFEVLFLRPEIERSSEGVKRGSTKCGEEAMSGCRVRAFMGPPTRAGGGKGGIESMPPRASLRSKPERGEPESFTQGRLWEKKQIRIEHQRGNPELGNHTMGADRVNRKCSLKITFWEQKITTLYCECRMRQTPMGP